MTERWGTIAYAVQARVVLVSKWRAFAIRLSIPLISPRRFSATIRRFFGRGSGSVSPALIYLYLTWDVVQSLDRAAGFLFIQYHIFAKTFLQNSAAH